MLEFSGRYSISINCLFLKAWSPKNKPRIEGIFFPLKNIILCLKTETDLSNLDDINLVSNWYG